MRYVPGLSVDELCYECDFYYYKIKIQADSGGADFKEKLRITVKSGSEVEIKALLREPGCDAVAKDGRSAMRINKSKGVRTCAIPRWCARAISRNRGL